MDKTADVINLNDEKVERWRKLAENSTPVTQICTIPREGDWESVLVEEGGDVIAKGMDYLDAFFYGEARVAVLALADELMLTQQYIDYIKAEVVAHYERRAFGNGGSPLLPMTFEQYRAFHEVEQLR